MKHKFLVLWASALLVCVSAYATYPGAKDEWKDFRPPPASFKTVEGFAQVVDGDTVVVNGTRVRLKGVDAPELSHPSGIEAKLALQGIIGPSLTCQLTGERTHDREVGWCYNNFGSDIGAAIILAGKALACPHYDRRYVALEQPDAIARLPRASYCRARG
jgi:endonuclease YncB( thermonuclease family)